MNSIDSILKNKFNEAFPRYEDLLDYEISNSELSYTTFVVSIFSRWLTREEFYKVWHKTIKEKKYEFNKKRVILLKSLFPDIFYYCTEIDIVFEFNSLNEFDEFITNAINKNEFGQLTFFSIKNKLLIEMSNEYNDFWSFKDIDISNEYKKIFKKNELNYFLP